MKAIFVALASLASLASFASAGISDCGTNSLFKITRLSQTPDTYVKPGDNTTLILNYDVPSSVSSGTATTSVSINGIPFSPSTENLCTKVSCPIASGSHDGSSWTAFPSGVSGKIVSKVVWSDSTGRELLCLKSNFIVSAFSTGPVNLFGGVFPESYESSSGGSSSGSSSYDNSTSSGTSATGGGGRSTQHSKKLRGYLEW